MANVFANDDSKIIDLSFKISANLPSLVLKYEPSLDIFINKIFYENSSKFSR